MKLIGYRSTVAFELGALQQKQIQTANLWVAGKCVNPGDNSLYLPAFYGNLRNEIGRLKQTDLTCPLLTDCSDERVFEELGREHEHIILGYDISVLAATTCFLERERGNTVLCSFLPHPRAPSSDVGLVFGAHLPKNELIAILEQTLASLPDKWV